MQLKSYILSSDNYISLHQHDSIYLHAKRSKVSQWNIKTKHICQFISTQGPYNNIYFLQCPLKENSREIYLSISKKLNKIYIIPLAS